MRESAISSFLTKSSEILQESDYISLDKIAEPMNSIIRSVVAIVALLLHPSAAIAQGGGIVSGTASDETAACCRARASSSGLRHNTPLETVTDGTGVYRFENVPAGEAELEFRLINFGTVRRTIT